MNEVWLYPSQYNEIHKDSNIRIVEKAYSSEDREELDSSNRVASELLLQNKILIEALKEYERLFDNCTIAAVILEKVKGLNEKLEGLGDE